MSNVFLFCLCAITGCNIVACRKPDVSVIGEEVTIVSKWPGTNSYLDDDHKMTFAVYVLY